MEQEFEHVEETLENKNPELLLTLFQHIVYFFTNYGWHTIFATIIVAYIYSKIHPYIDSYFKKKEEDEYAAKYHKNSDLYQTRQEAVDRSRQRMQENLAKGAEKYLVKQAEREERKRQEILNNTAHLAGNRLGGNESKKSFKPEYNPLMGSSSGSNYRAPKKSACGGGGCGK